MVGNGWDEDGERWLWKLGLLFLFSAASALLLSSDGAAVIGSVDEREWQRFQE